MNLSNACRPLSYSAHEFFFAQNHGNATGQCKGSDPNGTRLNVNLPVRLGRAFGLLKAAIVAHWG